MDDQQDKIIIGFDMDGVIIDQTEPKIRIAKKLGYDIKPEQTQMEILQVILPPPVFKLVRELLYDDQIESQLSPLMFGTLDVLKSVKERQLPYFLISRRTFSDVAIELLRKHRLWPEYFNEKNSFFVRDPEHKNEKAVQLKLTHYIDDEMKILDVLSTVPHKFLFDPFDVFPPEPNFKKIRSWADFKEMVAI